MQTRSATRAAAAAAASSQTTTVPVIDLTGDDDIAITNQVRRKPASRTKAQATSKQREKKRKLVVSRDTEQPAPRAQTSSRASSAAAASTSSSFSASTNTQSVSAAGTSRQRTKKRIVVVSRDTEQPAPRAQTSSTAPSAAVATSSSSSSSTNTRPVPTIGRLSCCTRDVVYIDYFAFDPEFAGRLKRATTEKMYVVTRRILSSTHQQLQVLGSTGNLYTINIGTRLSCDCRDHIGRRKHCKHILMVLLKVFRMPTSSRAYERLTLSEEVAREILAYEAADPTVVASDELRKHVQETLYGREKEAEQKPNRRQPLDSSDCPICYEAFEEAQIEKILFCKTCGNNVHAECFDRWVAYNRQETRCVYCRSVWEAEKKTTAKGKNRVSRPEGYANFAAAAGLPQERDTSTYRPTRRRTRREYEEDDDDDDYDYDYY